MRRGVTCDADQIARIPREQPGQDAQADSFVAVQLNEQLRYLFSHLDEDNFSESFLSASLGETKALKTRVKDLEAPLKWVPLALTGVTSWSR